ncbi:MAG: DEAD/DEAH box helicase [Schwartzia sp. (in: firmicutes)]
MIKNIDIRSCAGERSYDKGCRYYEEGAVGRVTEEIEGQTALYRAKVSGTERYAVWARVESEKRIVAYDCTCPASMVYQNACKHVAALLKAVQALQGERQRQEEKKTGATIAGKHFLALFQEEKAPRQQREERIFLRPLLYVETTWGRILTWLEFRIGRDRLYVVPNIADMMERFFGGLPIGFGVQFALNPETARFAPGVSEGLWALLAAAWRDEKSRFSWQFHEGGQAFSKKRFFLTPSSMDAFLDIMAGEVFSLSFDEEIREVSVEDGLPPLHLRLDATAEGGAVTLAEGESLRLLHSSGRLALLDSILYRVPPEKASDLARLSKGFSGAAAVSLGQHQVKAFFAAALPALKKVAEVEIAPSLATRYEALSLSAEAYLDYHRDGISARLLFRYGAAAYDPLREKAPAPQRGKTLIIDKAAEEDVKAIFAAYGFTVEDGLFVQPEEEASYDFLTEGLPALNEKATVFYAEIFRRRPVRDMPPVTVGVSVSPDALLEVRFSADGLDFEEVAEVLKSYRLKRRYHRLKDGTFVTFEAQQLDAVADLVDSAALERRGDKAVAPLSHALYLDAAAREETELHVARSDEFSRLVTAITRPARDAWPVPARVAGVLRDYQVQGFNWLMALSAYHLGGILADDMGLGKTLQVIAFLLAKQEAGAAPSLVVAPTSLMYNWIEEIARFAPELRAVAIAGGKAQRREKLAAAEGLDVVVTTYHLLKRDIDDYMEMPFRYVFLDEAQHIKNPATQNAKAVKRLKTEGYFALTGTPIENTLMELWSIFDFLMPGYLLSYPKFRARYEVPIVRDDSRRAADDLRRHIAPFILRRMKKDVLTELPDKVESKLVSEMTPKQEKLYKAWFLRSQKEFAAILEEHGVDTGRIKILAILTRLRQIACDPALFLEDYDGGSGKLDLLMEVVEEAAASGHRLLVFSQFTAMLRRIARRLEEKQLAYSYLDGQTPARERLRLVNAFNAGDTPVFLISLKAGGTGLNLTGADMVVHYDPWWNPAVEEQATDRAYRIGQENKVQVLKLIAKDTIEEKIFDLQERKKALIDQMIQPGENFLGKLSEEELKSLFR